MLALSRKAGESIIINNDIEIVVLDVKGEQVKLGINAPKSVPIYRKEIYDQIQQANIEAMESDTTAEALDESLCSIIINN